MSALNCKGYLLPLSNPLVMGILNITPDSFFEGSRLMDEESLLSRAGKMLSDGALILDVGGQSTRPGSEALSVEEEMSRVIPAIRSLHKHFPEAVISIDTFQAPVAEVAVEAGASIVNDISAGNLDPKMIPLVAKLNVPYIMMHMRGNPQTMQQN